MLADNGGGNFGQTMADQQSTPVVFELADGEPSESEHWSCRSCSSLLLGAAATAYATLPQVDPSTVPTGILVANSQVSTSLDIKVRRLTFVRQWRISIPTKAELFNELVANVRESGAILRGQKAPARAFVMGGPDVKQIRAQYGLSQGEFAAMLGICVGNLRSWEQGRPANHNGAVASVSPDNQAERGARLICTPAPTR